MKIENKISILDLSTKCLAMLFIIGCGSWMPFGGDEKPEEEKEVTPPLPEQKEIAASSFQLTPTEKLTIKDKTGSEIGEVKIKSALIAIGDFTISKGSAFEQKLRKKHVLNMKDGKVYGQAFDYMFDEDSFSSIDINFVTLESPPPELNFAGLLKKHSVVVLGQAEIDSESQPLALQINPEKMISFDLPDNKALISEVALKLNINNLLDFSGTNLDKQKIKEVVKSSSSENQQEFATSISRNLQNSVSYVAKGPELAEEVDIPSTEIAIPADNPSSIKPEVLINDDTGLVSRLEDTIVATTVIPTTISEIPAPSGVSFVDENLEAAQLSGTVTILRSTVENLIESYALYWGKNDSSKLFETPIIVIERNAESLTFQLGESTTIPDGATHFIAYSRNAIGESTIAASVEILDNVQTETPIVLSPPPKSIDDGQRYNSTSNSAMISWVPPDDVSTISYYELALGTSQGSTDVLNWTNVGLVNSYQHSGPVPNGELIFASVRSVSTTSTASQAIFSDGYQNLECHNDRGENGLGIYLKVHGNTTPGLGGKHYSEGTKTLLDWSTVSAENNWSPSQSTRKLSDFCVAKYEMKLKVLDTSFTFPVIGTNGVTGDPILGYADTETTRQAVRAVSIPEGNPWGEIRHGLIGGNGGAFQVCQELGANYMLINNAQWQAIARNIENNAVNWNTTNADPSLHRVNRGHTRYNPEEYLAADSVGDLDDNPCFSIAASDCLNKSSSDYVQKRTHHLTSSQDAIWDFSGNVMEIVTDQNHRTAGHGENGIEVSASIASEPYNTEQVEEFKLQWGPAGDYKDKDATQGAGFGHLDDEETPGDRDYGSMPWPNDPGTPGGVLRGGYIYDQYLAGPFAVSLEYSGSELSRAIGFRCVYAP